MRIKFWGVRGSLPAPGLTADLREKISRILEASRGLKLDSSADINAFMETLPPYLTCQVGANTSCVEVVSGETRLILDAGSGLRGLGLSLGEGRTPPKGGLQEQGPRAAPPGLDLTFLISHTHWDHLQGFPFFAPAYAPGHKLTFYGRGGVWLKQALSLQQKAPLLFPIPLDGLASQPVCLDFPPEGLRLGELAVRSFSLPHPGGSLAFRVDKGAKSLVYATDYEFLSAEDEYAARFAEFARGADVLISDTQYAYLESLAREGWGHCSSFIAVELAMKAGIGSLFLFHHDPEHSDAKLFDNLEKTRVYYEILSGRNDMRIDLAVEGRVVHI